ncbi:hypothetical protein SAY86_015825 [Trapa natans]|uniref:Protein ZIP4 homolog n=1 Tax=Trapa natans TaxID=22666 RepID=A0AAN7L4T4_TRANT|nr:hypothetical protein SAY86_015825 [Trapa natans]
MRIAEISTPELRRSQADDQSPNSCPVLSQIESLIMQCEEDASSGLKLSQLATCLRQSLARLSQFTPLANSAKLQIWKLSYRLWNACVDLSNASSIRSSFSSPSSSIAAAEDQAMLRHVSADMLSLAGEVSGVASPEFKTAFFYYKIGVMWHNLQKFDQASSCLEKATDLLSKIDPRMVTDTGQRKLLLDLNIARSQTAWEVSDHILAVTLLNRAKSFMFGSSHQYKALASQYLVFGKSVLSINNENKSQNFKEALKLLNDALDLCEKGFSTARTRQETFDLTALKLKILRFMAAVHLQMEEYESVIKCVKVLREPEGGDQHPCLPVLAMKAWLGLGKYPEAEKELKGMVVNKGIPEGVWVSAVEAYFQAVGTAGMETTKGVFLGLLGRCHVSAGAAVRVIHRVVTGGGEGSRIRAKVVADLVSDKRVVALFAGDEAAKDRGAMHAILWNCAAHHFQSKDYETSAEVFEKSMLYVPHDMENRVLRAKSFRVLCLCYLGLSQLDRANEYIDEAEKMEPNIASAFLKFKIHLQKEDQDRALSQIQAMKTCLDFTPDFLLLAAHEAIACHAFLVAVASLSNLLGFYASGKSMPTAEVVVFRTLVTILTNDAGNEPEILKYIKDAHSRASEVGPDCFFGKGEVAKREVKWFAATSWNFGIKLGKTKDYVLSAEFLRVASELYGLLVDGPVDENSAMIVKSLILTVSAMLASENQKGEILDIDVKLGVELLDRAGKVLKSISSRMQLDDGQNVNVEPEFHILYTLNSYEIYGRMNDKKSQYLIVENFASSKACTPANLLQVGLTACQGPRPNHEVSFFALNQSLSELISSPSPDYTTVALVMRKLITITSTHKGDTDDDGVYNLYKQAYRIIVGLKGGEFPVEEGKWLATTAWNRAAIPIRLGHFDSANKWMKVGLEIAGLVPGMEIYKACMEDFVNGLEKKVGVRMCGENQPQMTVA